MGQIKNIKLHIVTDIKWILQSSKKWQKKRRSYLRCRRFASRSCASTSVLVKAVTDLSVQEKFLKPLPDRLRFSPKPDTQCDLSAFVVMKKSPFTAPYVLLNILILVSSMILALV